MTVPLCEHITSEPPKGEPLFARAIALDYRDGPTLGAVECASCPTAYRFDLLATDTDGIYDHAAWDRGEELRIYGLSMLPPGAFGRIVDLLSTVEHPRWPIWAPTMTGTAAELPVLIERDVVPLLEAAGSARVIVATHGLLAPILSSRTIDFLGNGHQRPDRDWFSLLGFAAHEPAMRLDPS